MRCKSISVILISLFLFSITASGQKQINSPYARFNLGNLESASSFKSLGMGGIGIGMKSGSSVFFENPASYSSIDTNTFIFDIGIDGGIIKLKDSQNQFKSNDINFSHLMMAFPISKGFGFAVGVVPMTNGYYKLSENVLKNSPNYDPLVGEYASAHNGDGGFHNLFVGTGLKVTKKLSLGVNMTVLFGQVNRSYQVVFSDYGNVYNNDATEKLEMNGVNLNYGLQYTVPLKHDYYFTAGISATSGKSYKSSYQQLAYKYTAYNTRDTISYIANDSTKTFIPGTIGLGFTFGRMNKFTAGFDFIMTKWSASTIPGGGNYAADSKSFRLGLEYIPDKYSNYSLIKRLEYRAGGHFGDTYLIMNDQQIKEYGASFGIGIPMRRTYSRTNIFFDFTRKSGSGSSIVHIEDYYTLGVSLNLYDFWFIKRKYE
jgi:hypothetical protein